MSKPKPATYEAKYTCSNCEWAGTLNLPKGQVKDKNRECPQCGCMTANPAPKAQLPVYTPWTPKPWVSDPWKYPESPTRWNNIIGGAETSYECTIEKDVEMLRRGSVKIEDFPIGS